MWFRSNWSYFWSSKKIITKDLESWNSNILEIPMSWTFILCVILQNVSKEPFCFIKSQVCHIDLRKQWVLKCNLKPYVIFTNSSRLHITLLYLHPRSWSHVRKMKSVVIFASKWDLIFFPFFPSYMDSAVFCCFFMPW